MRVVLHTNVIVAALGSRLGASFEILRRLRAGRFEAAVTVALLLEYEAILDRKRVDLGLSENDVGVIVDALAALSVRVAAGPSGRPRLADPGDELVLDAALAARAQRIVTHNVRHFAGVERFGLGVSMPGKFLAEEAP